jgi:glycosyltransferase involved in cell wall biosynthesis
MKAIGGYDVIMALGVSGGIFFPIFRLFCRKKLIINVDGLEWKRPKWGTFARLFLRLSEELALRFSDIVVADNQGIVDYITKRYKKESVLIAYGSDHVKRELPVELHQEILKDFHLEQNAYYLSICRIEPENNCELILDVFAHTGKRLVFIGNWERCEYGRALKEVYCRYENISVVDSIYDLDILYILRHNCRAYIHGHSAGGTNPSLVEAMFCGCNVLTYNVVYNRETTENRAHYFRDGIDLALLTAGDTKAADNSEVMNAIAERRYTWASIAQQYEALY